MGRSQFWTSITGYAFSHPDNAGSYPPRSDDTDRQGRESALRNSQRVADHLR